MGSVVRGWALARKSLRVVLADASLTVLVVLGAISSAAVAVALIVPAGLEWSSDRVLSGVLIVAGTYLSTATGVFFAVALAAAAAAVLDGKDATVASSIKVAGTRIGPIAAWTLYLTTVNLVLQALRNRTGVIGGVIGGAAGVAWSLVTFLVVPILALEGLSASDALSRSGQIFRERWGDQVVGQVSLSGIFFVFGALPAIVLVALGWESGSRDVTALLVAVAIGLLVAAAILAAAARAVFAVALYRFAVGERTAEPFSDRDLSEAVLRGSSAF